MVPIVIFLFFIGSCRVISYDILERDQYGIIERSGAYRVKRDPVEDAEKLAAKFPKTVEISCSNAHETSELPFTAIVLYRENGRLLCLGSIIDERHILTAKRCYEKVENTDLLVLLGYYRAYWGRWSQVLKVQKIVRHEMDLAILRLKQTISFTDYVQPTRLPPFGTGKWEFKDVYGGPPFSLTGFMVDRYDLPGDYIKKDLAYSLKENWDMVEMGPCAENYSKIVTDAKRQFCTFGNATFCWGGLGGAVLKSMPTSTGFYWLQVGVIVADNCTMDTIGPNLISRTDSYGEWIRGNTFHDHHPY